MEKLTVALSITKATREKLEAIKEETGLSFSAIVDRLVAQVEDNNILKDRKCYE